MNHVGHLPPLRQIENLLLDFEKLANRLAADEEIAALCGRAGLILESVRENTVRRRPWWTLGCVALGAAAIGFLAARR